MPAQNERLRPLNSPSYLGFIAHPNFFSIHKKIGILEGVSGFKDADLFTVPMDKLLSCFHFATASFLSESPSKYVLAEGENTLRANVPWALLPKPEAFWNRETFCVHASPRRAYSQKGFRPDSERGRQSPKTGPEHPRGL